MGDEESTQLTFMSGCSPYMPPYIPHTVEPAVGCQNCQVQAIEELTEPYQKQTGEFFDPGRVFAMLCREPPRPGHNSELLPPTRSCNLTQASVRAANPPSNTPKSPYSISLLYETRNDTVSVLPSQPIPAWVFLIQS